MCKRRRRKPHFGWKRIVSFTLFKKMHKNAIFSLKRGGGVRRVRPMLDPPLVIPAIYLTDKYINVTHTKGVFHAPKWLCKCWALRYGGGVFRQGNDKHDKRKTRNWEIYGTVTIRKTQSWKIGVNVCIPIIWVIGSNLKTLRGSDIPCFAVPFRDSFWLEQRACLALSQRGRRWINANHACCVYWFDLLRSE